ncbi:alkylated DNA nucleotide flippase Atl1 [Streptomyces sp. V3I8]|uniref:peptidoglycan DD-metalloendopeptidase family protein n=1 Tax=Streptomyces sp. V3I8 TaxID=3042279 RepID=UPI002789E91E|nr:peptidoglycan DD-metalloendopeptidase family protein [Streptomyces sp. V3I8]MDQ1036873.1 alkylated DNA nucleotide flippase Atl1 [Streptomyces sp. V3I8]
MRLGLRGMNLRAGLVAAAALLLPLAAATSGHAATNSPTGAGTAATAFAGSCPAAGVVSQGYSSSHDGVDIANSLGTPIYAVGAGEVIASGPAQGYGQWIRILHSDGTVTEYGHMYQRDVSVGQQVSAGQRIALMGSEGDSTGVHLHLRVRVGTSTTIRGIDPVPYLGDRGVGLPCTPGEGEGSTTVTAWTDANVRSCAARSCGIVSSVKANESYPAHCWVVGESVTDEGITNDKWIRLPLNAGGVGYVSGIYLKGDETGGVSAQCS